MPKQIVKQPDDLYAIFSTIGDQFIIWGMSYDNMLNFVASISNSQTAQKLMDEAEQDIISDDYELDDGVSGGKRWNNSLEEIAANQGIEAVQEAVNKLSITDYEIPSCLFEISAGLEEDRLAFGGYR